jgi:hypothetical protein
VSVALLRHCSPHYLPSRRFCCNIVYESFIQHPSKVQSTALNYLFFILNQFFRYSAALICPAFFLHLLFSRIFFVFCCSFPNSSHAISLASFTLSFTFLDSYLYSFLCNTLQELSLFRYPSILPCSNSSMALFHHISSYQGSLLQLSLFLLSRLPIFL